MNNNGFTRRNWLKFAGALGLATLVIVGVSPMLRAETKNANGLIDIGTRRELFIDTHLIDRFEGQAEQRLHRPIPREIVLVHDAPWEGTGSGYHSIFQDGERYRMYYKAWHLEASQGKLDTGRQELREVFEEFGYDTPDQAHYLEAAE